MKDYQYYNNCVNWDRSDVNAEGGLVSMIESAMDITRRTFLKHTSKKDAAELEDGLGYTSNFKMKGDHHVSYHKSKLHNEAVYFIRHSAIEYVFIKLESIKILRSY